MNPDDLELLEGCRRGSIPARERFVRRFAGLVHWSVRKTLGAETGAGVEAADVFQEVFRKIFEPGALDAIRDSEAVKGWIVVVSCRTALDAVRRGSRRLRLETALDEPGEGSETPAWESAELAPGPAEAALEAERQRLVREAIELLPPREKACVRYHYVEGWTHARIGELLGLSKDAVSAILHRCRERLKRLLEEKGYSI